MKAISATCYSSGLRKSCRNHYLVAGDKGSDLQERADRTSDNGRLRDLQRSYERSPPARARKRKKKSLISFVFSLKYNTRRARARYTLYFSPSGWRFCAASKNEITLQVICFALTLLLVSLVISIIRIGVSQVRTVTFYHCQPR